MDIDMNVKASTKPHPERPSEYYRRMRPEYFSDSEVIYEVPLTEELFDAQMNLLSTKNLQSAFESFIVDVAMRLITPNIKPQTGPDGGGDGKVDAETYETSADISDKWYSEEEGATGNEKWAFAISCKTQWKPKVEGDVKKIVETNRGYTRVLFFSNQYIKSSVRSDIEKKLSDQYGVRVDIFDRLWCSQAVFRQGCLDIALFRLRFSDEYKRCTRRVGIHDKRRLERLAEIEKTILRPVSGLDTGYVDELRETCIISRGLGRPRTEVEGRFRRAISECDKHGTHQQKFNILYDHAWTCYFWFDDVETTYQDYLKLKPFICDDCSVYRLERLTNLLSVLATAVTYGFIEKERIQKEIEYIKDLEKTLAKDASRPACYLFIRLRIQTQRLIYHIPQPSMLKADLRALKPLLLEAASCIEISFESQYEIMEMLSRQIDSSAEFDNVVDEMANVLATQRSEVEAAKVRLARAQAHMDKRRWKEAVRQLSFCVYAFEKEEYTDELIQSAGLMGLALWEMRLPYSAEAFLVKSVCFLLKDFQKSGHVPHLLVSTLAKLCEIELMLGRLVMYLNWFKLMMAVAQNSKYYEDPDFVKKNSMADLAWMCRFAVSNLTEPYFERIPSILERHGLIFSSSCLKYALGYEDECEKDFLETMRGDKSGDWLSKQPVFKQFLCDLNVSREGAACLQTTVNNFTFKVDYRNDYAFQQIAEIFLASMESLLSTYDTWELMPLHNEIVIHIVRTDDENDVRVLEIDKYEFGINMATFTDKVFWECLIKFIAHAFSRNAITKSDIATMLNRKQDGERMMDRVAVLQQTKMAFAGVFGSKYQYRIEDWFKSTDKIYTNKVRDRAVPNIVYKNRLQSDATTYLVNKDMSIWNEAGWNGCLVATDYFSPPILGLIFESIEKGRLIVNEWRRCTMESRPSIKIYFIKGINAAHPCWYRVCIFPDFTKEDKEHDGQYVSIMCRNHTMTPKTNKNLLLLEQEYDRFGECRLIPVTVKDWQSQITRESLNAFRFSKLIFKNAFEIAVGDEAVSALTSDDNPYIPDEHKNDAPILKVLEHLKQIRDNYAKTDAEGGV